MSSRISLRRIDKATLSQLFLCFSSDFKTKILCPTVNSKMASGYAINDYIKLSSRWLEDAPESRIYNGYFEIDLGLLNVKFNLFFIINKSISEKLKTHCFFKWGNYKRFE
jgi:hypothetical protein